MQQRRNPLSTAGGSVISTGDLARIKVSNALVIRAVAVEPFTFHGPTSRCVNN